jgi:hypothetical protein
VIFFLQSNESLNILMSTFLEKSFLSAYLVFNKLYGSTLCMIFCFLSYQVTLAQASDREAVWILSIAPTGSSVYVIDKTFSASPFSGNEVGGAISFLRKKVHSWHELQVQYGYGTLKNSAQGLYKMNQELFSFDYLYLHELDLSAKLNFTYYAGAGLHFIHAGRKYEHFVNNSSSFEYFASLGGVFQVGYSFDKGFSITDRIQIPVISSVVQPAFGSEYSAGNINDLTGVSSFGKSNRIMSFGSFFRCRNDLRLDKSIASKKSLAIGYTWDYYQIGEPRELKSVSHQIMFILSVNL